MFTPTGSAAKQAAALLTMLTFGTLLGLTAGCSEYKTVAPPAESAPENPAPAATNTADNG